MALRKIYIAVDCADDAQKDAVQKIFNEVSNMRIFNGSQIQSFYPYVKAHQQDLFQLFSMVSKNGVKSLMSASGIAVVTRLAKR
jgi:hypothetical protein